MVRFPEATSRLFVNVFVCKKCKSKVRTSMQQVLQKKIICRRCGSRSFRAIKKTRVKA